MSLKLICLICGSSDSEEVKMHFFPSKLESSKIWQENMGITYTGETLHNRRICSRHFDDSRYIRGRLQRGSVPTRFPCSSSEGSHVLPSPSSNVNSDATEMPSNVPVSPDNSSESTTSTSATMILIPGSSSEMPSTSSRTRTPSPMPLLRKSRRSLFKGIETLSRIESTPRKVFLMDRVTKNEDQIRKLKKISKKRGHDIKALQDLSDSDVVRNLFKGMSQTTANFLISQLRCATRTPHGRRWTEDDKVVALAIYKRGPRSYRFLSKLVALPSRRTLKTQILNGLTTPKISIGNCEADDGELLNDLRTFLSAKKVSNSLEEGKIPTDNIPQSPTTSSDLSDISASVSLGEMKVLSVAYVSGFIVKTLLKTLNCAVCRDMLTSEPTELHNAFITFKEWSETDSKLAYPAEDLVVLVGTAITDLEEFIPIYGGKPGITEAAIQRLMKNFSLTTIACETHIDEVKRGIALAVCRIGIPWWVKRRNQTLKEQKKGSRETKRKIAIMKH